MIAHSTSKRNLKVQKLGPSSEQQALMVRIDWTTSQVVTITAREDFKMSTVTMWVRKDGYQVISTQDVPVLKGTKLYFVASNEQGWYYLLKWSESLNKHACTCPAGRIRHNCRHQHILSDHLESQTTKVAQPARELRNVYGGGEYWPQYRDENGVWQHFKDEQGHKVRFLGGHEYLAHEFIRVDSDECRNAVLAELQRMIDEQWAEYDAEQARKAVA